MIPVESSRFFILSKIIVATESSASRRERDYSLPQGRATTRS